MKNKQYNSDYNKYFIKEPNGDVTLVCTQFSKSGNLTAFSNYSDTVLAKAGGGGYDKVSTVINDAFNELYDIELGTRGVGIEVTKKKALEHGYNIYSDYDLINLVYNAR